MNLFRTGTFWFPRPFVCSSMFTFDAMKTHATLGSRGETLLISTESKSLVGF